MSEDKLPTSLSGISTERLAKEHKRRTGEIAPVPPPHADDAAVTIGIALRLYRRLGATGKALLVAGTLVGGLEGLKATGVYRTPSPDQHAAVAASVETVKLEGRVAKLETAVGKLGSNIQIIICLLKPDDFSCLRPPGGPP